MELQSSLPQEFPTRKFVPPMLRIASEVAHSHKLSIEQMRLPRRFGPIIVARWEFYYRAASETKKSMKQIGAYLGQDHTAVGRGIARFCKMKGLPQPRTTWATRASLKYLDCSKRSRRFARYRLDEIKANFTHDPTIWSVRGPDGRFMRQFLTGGDLNQNR